MIKTCRQKKSQAWSFDVIIAVIIFVGAFFLFYSLFKQQAGSSVEDLRRCAELVSKEVLSESSAINIIRGRSSIDEAKLQNLVDEEYPTFKSKIRAGCDFCIFIEDQQGNVVYIRSDVTGVGSSKINVSNIPCS